MSISPSSAPYTGSWSYNKPSSQDVRIIALIDNKGNYFPYLYLDKDGFKHTPYPFLFLRDIKEGSLIHLTVNTCQIMTITKYSIKVN